MAATVRTLKLVLGWDGSQVDRGAEQTERKVGSLEGQVESLSSKVTKGATLLGGLGAALLGGGAAMVKMAGDVEQLKVAFTVMLGDGEKAQQLLEELQQFAASTPFQFNDIADAGRKLLAFGVSAEQVTEELRRIGDVSAGVQAPIAEIAELYGKAKVQGRLFAEDINQLTGRGIPIIQELAKQFGVSENKVKGLVEEGKVGFPQLQQAFVQLTEEGGKFAGLMEAQSGTVLGLFSTLKDNVILAAQGIGQGIVDALDLKSKMSGAIEFLQEIRERVVAFVEANPELVKFAATFAAVGTAIGGVVVVAGPLVAALNPVTAILAGLAAGAALVINNWEDVEAFFRRTFPGALGVFKRELGEVKRVVKGFIDDAGAFWKVHGETIKEVLSAVAQFVMGNLASMAGMVVDTATTMIQALRIVTNFLSGEWGTSFELSKHVLKEWGQFYLDQLGDWLSRTVYHFSLLVRVFDKELGQALHRLAKDLRDMGGSGEDAATDMETLRQQLEKNKKTTDEALATLENLTDNLDSDLPSGADKSKRSVEQLAAEAGRLKVEVEGVNEAALSSMERGFLNAREIGLVEQEAGGLTWTIGVLSDELRTLEGQAPRVQDAFEQTFGQQIAGLVNNFARDFGDLFERTSPLGEKVLTFFSAAGPWGQAIQVAIRAIPQLREEFETALAEMEEAVFGLADAFGSVLDQIESLGDRIQGVVSEITGASQGFVSEAFSFIKGVFNPADRVRQIGRLFRGGGDEPSVAEQALEHFKKASEDLAFQAQVLGDDFDFVGAQMSLLEDTLISMLREGVKPTDEIFQFLTQTLEGLRQSAADAAENIEEVIEEVEEFTRPGGPLTGPEAPAPGLGTMQPGVPTTLMDAVMADLDEAMQAIAREAEIAAMLGQDFDRSAAEAKAYEEAIRALADTYGLNDAVVKGLIESYRALTEEQKGVEEIFDPVQDVMDDLTEAFSQIVTEFGFFEDPARMLEDQIRATRQAMEELADIGTPAAEAAFDHLAERLARFETELAGLAEGVTDAADDVKDKAEETARIVKQINLGDIDVALALGDITTTLDARVFDEMNRTLTTIARNTSSLAGAEIQTINVDAGAGVFTEMRDFLEEIAAHTSHLLPTEGGSGFFLPPFGGQGPAPGALAAFGSRGDGMIENHIHVEVEGREIARALQLFRLQ